MSLWQRDDLQSLVNDPILTNAAVSGASLGDLVNAPAVRVCWRTKPSPAVILGAVTNQLDDLTNYLQTGKSPRYDGEKILGNWEFNAGVTLAWLAGPAEMSASDMRGIRALWSQAYAQTTLLFTGDNQLFVNNYPKFVQPQGNEPPFQLQTGKAIGAATETIIRCTSRRTARTSSYRRHDGVRLTLRDGRTSLIFDHVE